MKKNIKIKMLFLVVVLVLNSVYIVNAEIPQGYKKINSAPGVNIYQKEGENTFVQIIDLLSGAKIKLYGGKRLENFGDNNNPVIQNFSIREHWNRLKSIYPKTVSVCNGVQFDQDGDFTYTQYPAKSSDWFSFGSMKGTSIPNDSSHCTSPTLRIIEFWDNHATINDCNDTPDCAVNSLADDLIVHLADCVPQRDFFSIGRTVMGLKDEGNNGFNTLLIASSEDKRKNAILNIMDSFGVDRDNLILLDASTASQLIFDNDVLIETKRKIPQIIGVLHGNVSYELLVLNENVSPQTTNLGLSVKAECYVTLSSLSGNDAFREYEIYLGLYLSKDKISDDSDIYLGHSVQEVNNQRSVYIDNLVTIPSNIDAGQWNILFIPFLSDNLKDIITKYNTASKTITVDDLSGSAPKIPDIVISDFTIASSTKDTNTITTLTNISNYGTSPTNKNFLIHYYLSDSSVFENTDIYLGYENISSMSAKESKQLNKSLTIPDNLNSGDWHLIAVSDATNEIEEINEDNNYRSLLFKNTATSNSLPDIAITYPYVTPAIPESGSTITAGSIIQNQGKISTGKNFILRFYLSEDRVLDDTDESLGVMSVPPLDSGKTTERENELTLPTDLQSRSYYILFEADTHKEISESNENNNVTYAPFVVKEDEPEFTDLLLEIAEIRPSVVKLDEHNTQLRIRIRNIGTIKSDECTIAYYLSTDDTLDDNDTYLQQDTISALYPNYTNIKETDITLSSSLGEGNYYIIFSLDNGEQVTESDETNNIVAKLFEIKDYVSAGEPGTFSDLVLENVTFDKSTGYPCGNIKVAFNVKNNGDLGTVTSSRIGYYISKNGDNWDSNDILLATNYFGSILPSAMVAIEKTIILPSNLQLGETHLIIYADYQEKVAESNDNNNTYSKALTISYNQEMTVFIPNAETSWARKRKHNITWASNLGGNVKIELCRNLTIEKIIASATPNTGSFIWNAPDDLYPADNYRIKITSSSDSSKYDFSDYFNIVYEDFITVLEPKTGFEFGFNTARIIKWETAALGGVNKVDIHLFKDDVFYQEIDNFVETVKTKPTFYDWKVPDDLQTSSNYTIKVVSSTDSETYGFSGPFSIKESGLVAEVTIDDIALTQINKAVSIKVLSNDNPPSGTTLSISSITQPSNGSALISTDKQSITYTPDNNFIGTDSFSYSVSVNNKTSSANIYVDVNELSTDPATWLKSAGGTATDKVEGIAVDYNGNVYITGDYNNTAFGTITLSGSGVFIAKYKSNGSFDWVQRIEAGSYGTAYGIDVDNVGNVYIIGDFYSQVTFYEESTIKHQFNAVNASEVFFAKYSPLGKIIWAKVATGAYDDNGYSIAVNKTSGEFSITGSFNDDITFGSGSSSTSLSVSDTRVHTYIAKYNKDAVPIWAKKVDGSHSSLGYGIAITNSGDVIVTGYFNESATFYGSPNIILSNEGNDTFYLAKLSSSNGNALWAQKAEGEYSNDGRAITIDKDDNIFVVGKFASTLKLYNGNSLLKTLTGKSSSSDVFVAKYNSSGLLQWAQQAGGTSYDYGFDISLINNNPIATGYFSRQADFGTGNDIKQLESKGSTDAFAWIIDKSTGLNIKVVSLGGTGSEVGKGIEGDDEGTIYLTGNYSNTVTFDKDNQDIEISSVNNSTDVFIGKFVEIKPEPQKFDPIAVKDDAFTLINNSIKISVLENDSDLDGDAISILSFTQPTNGNISMNDGDLFITYSPNEGFIGTDKFEYTIIDSNEITAKAEVNIFVFDLNEAPTLYKIPNQTIQIGGQFKTIDLNLYVSDDNTLDESISWSIEGATDLSININNGIATILPINPNWTGSETITFIATDERGASQNSKATFSINPLFNETPTIIQIKDQSIQKGKTFQVIALDSHVIDDHTSRENIKWSVVSGEKISVELTNRTALVTVDDNNWVGNENITFIAKDEGNLANSQVVTFSVNPIDYKKGDINNDKDINLTDLILTLKIMVESEINQSVNIKSDVNEDEKIGIEELIFIIQKITRD